MEPEPACLMTGGKAIITVAALIAKGGREYKEKERKKEKTRITKIMK